MAGTASLRGKTTWSEKLQRSLCTEETSLSRPACPPSALNNVCSGFQLKVTGSTRLRCISSRPYSAGLDISAGLSPEINDVDSAHKMSAANVSCVHNIHKAKVRGFIFQQLSAKRTEGNTNSLVGSYVRPKAFWSYSDLY